MAVRLPVATVFVFKTGFYIAQPGLESMGEDELKLLTSTGMTGLCHLTGGHIAWDWTQGFLHARQARLPTEPHPTPRQWPSAMEGIQDHAGTSLVLSPYHLPILPSLESGPMQLPQGTPAQPSYSLTLEVDLNSPAWPCPAFLSSGQAAIL